MKLTVISSGLKNPDTLFDGSARVTFIVWGIYARKESKIDAKWLVGSRSGLLNRDAQGVGTGLSKSREDSWKRTRYPCNIALEQHTRRDHPHWRRLQQAEAFQPYRVNLGWCPSNHVNVRYVPLHSTLDDWSRIAYNNKYIIYANGNASGGTHIRMRRSSVRGVAIIFNGGETAM